MAGSHGRPLRAAASNRIYNPVRDFRRRSDDPAMEIEFDPDKDAINLATHGISLARAADLEILAFIADDRGDYGETRYRA